MTRLTVPIRASLGNSPFRSQLDMQTKTDAEPNVFTILMFYDMFSETV